MRLWVRPEVTWHIQSDQFLSTIQLAPDTQSQVLLNMFITARVVVYCQINNEGALPARQLLLHLKCFHSVPIHLFYQINNTALRGGWKPLIKKSHLSQGNCLVVWSSLSLPISDNNQIHALRGSGILTWFPFLYCISGNTTRDRSPSRP